jgi:hypothetical protein
MSDDYQRQRLDVGLAGDPTADITDDPPEPNAQEAQLAVMPVELLGVGVAPRHHRSPLHRRLHRGSFGQPEIPALH